MAIAPTEPVLMAADCYTHIFRANSSPRTSRWPSLPLILNVDRQQLTTPLQQSSYIWTNTPYSPNHIEYHVHDEFCSTRGLLQGESHNPPHPHIAIHESLLCIHTVEMICIDGFCRDRRNAFAKNIPDLAMRSKCYRGIKRAKANIGKRHVPTESFELLP